MDERLDGVMGDKRLLNSVLSVLQDLQAINTKEITGLLTKAFQIMNQPKETQLQETTVAAPPGTGTQVQTADVNQARALMGDGGATVAGTDGLRKDLTGGLMAGMMGAMKDAMMAF